MSKVDELEQKIKQRLENFYSDMLSLENQKMDIKTLRMWENKYKQEAISQIKSLAKKKAKECVWYWFDTRTHYDENGKSYKEPLKKRKIIKESEIIDMINSNIDRKFK